MMLDAFGVKRRCLDVYANCQQKLIDRFMATLRFYSHSPPIRRERYWTIRLGIHEAIFLKSLDNLVDGYVAYTKVV